MPASPATSPSAPRTCPRTAGDLPLAVQQRQCCGRLHPAQPEVPVERRVGGLAANLALAVGADLLARRVGELQQPHRSADCPSSAATSRAARSVRGGGQPSVIAAQVDLLGGLDILHRRARSRRWAARGIAAACPRPRRPAASRPVRAGPRPPPPAGRCALAPRSTWSGRRTRTSGPTRPRPCASGAAGSIRCAPSRCRWCRPRAPRSRPRSRSITVILALPS